ncbi:MAG: type I methionyl aminopeptidase [Candidatus Moranbacteria bacterium]|nr:type I methionyl aminopeptidase [Candidatus Moranbacteria bacterium]OIQ01578.1 MAG: type I methionyl aminopeptidase [Candidatus Moranbacteria bacterium CG2_30_41_165]PIP25789.1 MAG: type I methionyl aminopeptidase [Candidatus Moranbacteria bacterium CG23_combo_of_CG06-09_8_20_14_all_41_28]PIV86642.1 MAG: type I methionyl aminopeptidase [Candidatus Moranbacteria bacterium CG17_big_fil_post_rev_8_21_14_2_50_41_107]PIW94435.1 MAG: type I methionyl aminopeptidase [Candidatus Moranbacteria bacter
MSKEWIKTADEIDRLRHSCHELARILDILMKALRPGMSTQDIDDMSEKLMLEIGAIPIFKGYMGGSGRPFPATLCTSINEEVVHGIPNKNKIIKEGDLVKLDIGMRYEGMVSDMARTIKIGSVSPVAERLTQVTEECLQRGIEKLRPGAHIFDYARAVQEHAEANGFSVVRDLVGHGVGRELHEDPQVPNYVSRSMDNFVLGEGMTLALEPMVNVGTYEVDIADDDWAFITADDELSAHFENTVVITKDGAEILTKL